MLNEENFPTYHYYTSEREKGYKQLGKMIFNDIRIFLGSIKADDR